jgi:hypothetical protein
MSIFKKLFGKTLIQQDTQKGNEKEPEHAVIVYFDYKKDNLEPLHKLEDELEKVIAKHNVGEYDGNEMAINLNDGILFMYGPNAELLYKAIKPTLLTRDFMKGAKAKLRFGPPEDGVTEIEVQVAED